MAVVDDDATNLRFFEQTLKKWQLIPTLARRGACLWVAAASAPSGTGSFERGPHRGAAAHT
jgi:hypothetical protein